MARAGIEQWVQTSARNATRHVRVGVEFRGVSVDKEPKDVWPKQVTMLLVTLMPVENSMP
jgi:hypothetical protein